jgi:hypothetical protein
MKKSDVVGLLGYVMAPVNQQLLLLNENLTAEKSHFARSHTVAVAADRTAKVYAGGNRKAVGPESPAADRACGATRYDPILVATTHRKKFGGSKVERIPVALRSSLR